MRYLGNFDESTIRHILGVVDEDFNGYHAYVREI